MINQYRGLLRTKTEQLKDQLYLQEHSARMAEMQASSADRREAAADRREERKMRMQLLPGQLTLQQQSIDAGKSPYGHYVNETDEMTGRPTGRVFGIRKSDGAKILLQEPRPSGSPVSIIPPAAGGGGSPATAPSGGANPSYFDLNGSTNPGGMSGPPAGVIPQPIPSGEVDPNAADLMVGDPNTSFPVVGGVVGDAKGGKLNNSLSARVKSCGGRADGGATSEYSYTPKYEDLHNEFRTGDVLYDGTDTIHGSDGTTTTPELLAAAYKNDPNSIPSSFSGYKGKYYGTADVTDTGAESTSTQTDSSQQDALKTVQAGNSGDGFASFNPANSEALGGNSGNNALNMTVVGEKGPEVVLTPQGSDGYVLPITDKHAEDLLKWGVTGREDGGGTGGGDHDHDSDGGDGGSGGGDSDSDGGGRDTGGVDNGGDGTGDRGMDAGSLGGSDRGGTGSDTDGSDYGGHGFERSGRDGGSRSSGSVGQGPYSARFQAAFRGAYDPSKFGAKSTAEAVESMDPTSRANYVSNVDALDQSPNADLSVDTTPQSNAKSMFSNALAKQVADSVNLGNVIDQGLQAAGYPSTQTNPTSLSDFGKYNMTAFPGSSKQNALSSAAFGDYATNSKIGSTALGIMRDMESEGYDMSGFGITSANQGVHAKNSKHYSGDAVDVNSKVDSRSFGEFSSRMAAAGYSRGDRLGFGRGESHHFQ
jgi:hypothetical protein